jgi:alkylation response protein AidB-like acyl-CoA dehydrogenase
VEIVVNGQLDADEPDADAEFRASARSWLHTHLTGEFAQARGLGGPGREHEAFETRLAWEQHLAAAGWTALGWPVSQGGRGATLRQRVIFAEEYAAADAPARVNHIGEELLGPTLIAFGTPDQQRRFLPGIAAVRELWCQGYSEPGAGSDLAAVATRATLEGGEWVITGQKVWTSLAHVADWCFVLCRTTPASLGSSRREGLSYLLVPMRQPGVEVRPIVQLTGTSEFNEVFFDGARTSAANVVGEVGGGWAVAMATLGFERGIATLAQQVGFRRELARVWSRAEVTGALADPLIRDRLVRSWMGLRLLRLNALRTLGAAPGAGAPGGEASMAKLLWARWHRDLGELAVDVEGLAGAVADAPPYDLTDAQRLYLFTRADTIYGGSDEIQRNILAERVLGLPR